MMEQLSRIGRLCGSRAGKHPDAAEEALRTGLSLGMH
jgi:hypothetical protein